MAHSYEYTQNRELSWLKFNERVLEEAADRDVPLLERLKFISIFTSNLDEFYMVRCGSLYDLSILDEEHIDNKSGMNAQQQLQAIYRETKKLYLLRDSIYKNVRNELKPLIHRVRFSHLSREEEKRVRAYFLNRVLPILSPQIIDIHHPFPHMANKKLYVMIRLSAKKKELYGLVPIPDTLPRTFTVSKEDSLRLILLEDIVAAYVKELFTGYEVQMTMIVSVTRNADINLDAGVNDEDEDYRQQMKKILKKRRRLAPIRLEVYREADRKFVAYLCEHLQLKEEQVFVSRTPLDLSYVFALSKHKDRLAALLYPPFQPQPSRDLSMERPIMDQLLKQDALLFYPYESIDPFLRLLKEAARDPDVTSIRITVYRLARNSKIIRHLVEAADNGKDVTVLMELRARFDEQNNIEYAELLENSGCNVLYGIENYKVHSKLCLITRSVGNEVQYFTQIGTGNYNEKTSAQYTDYSYMTARKSIGQDAVNFFQNMAIGNLQGNYRELLVSPYSLKARILELIDAEIDRAAENVPARIFMKMNSMTDRDIIDQLQKASAAGVQVRLIIRGICCLLPGVPGQTEHIEVHSIVGRYLEHARVYCFGYDPHCRLYIASADMMTRNTEKRVEVGCPIYDPKQKARILHDMELMWRDNVKARNMDRSGCYEIIDNGLPPLDAQVELMKEAEAHAQELKETPKQDRHTWLMQFRHRRHGRK